jgi:hypothetical protein
MVAGGAKAVAPASRIVYLDNDRFNWPILAEPSAFAGIVNQGASFHV